jgi:hypothetical protein
VDGDSAQVTLLKHRANHCDSVVLGERWPVEMTSA